MWIVDSGLNESTLAKLQPGDPDLLAGANYSSDVTVSEVVVTAPSGGGGTSYVVDFNDYQTGGGTGGVSAFDAWAQTIASEADTFASQHVHGDPSSPVYQQAHNALAALYALVRSSPAFLNTPMNMPNNNTLTFNELGMGIAQIDFHIGPIASNNAAYTQWNSNGTHADIYIDPSKLDQYKQEFGTNMGIDYVIYHELAHALPDGYADRNSPNVEAIANSYGQGLATLDGVYYPSNSQLASVGGTSQ